MTINHIDKQISVHRDRLLKHPLYKEITHLNHLQEFMQVHVFAVWDFMSLLKALQAKLTCTTTPWFASPHPQTRYLINEIVLAEESDLTIDNRRLSHFEMYLEAMEDLNFKTHDITNFIISIHHNNDVFLSIKDLQQDQRVKDFLFFTFDLIAKGQAHEIAAAFTFGREDLIPSMFIEILAGFKTHFPTANLEKLIYYFERHIELDQDEHGPMAMAMVTELCGDQQKKWKEVEEVSIKALQKRFELWNAILDNITANGTQS